MHRSYLWCGSSSLVSSLLVCWSGGVSLVSSRPSRLVTWQAVIGQIPLVVHLLGLSRVCLSPLHSRDVANCYWLMSSWLHDVTNCYWLVSSLLRGVAGCHWSHHRLIMKSASVNEVSVSLSISGHHHLFRQWSFISHNYIPAHTQNIYKWSNLSSYPLTRLWEWN